MAGITTSQHWLNTQKRKTGHAHINRIRISASTLIKLMALRNEVSGEKKSIRELSLASEEVQQEQQW